MTRPTSMPMVPTKTFRATRNVFVGGFSLFVVLSLAGFLAGPPSSAFATSLARRHGNGVIYGKVLNAKGRGEFRVRVELYQMVRGKEKVVAFAGTNRQGVYRFAHDIKPGNYYLKFETLNNARLGVKEFHATKGHDYRIEGHQSLHGGLFFYLPIFSY